MDIDAKINKSLDDLIKEKEQERKAAKTKQGSRGKGKLSGGGRGDKPGNERDDAGPSRGDGNPRLKPQGGVKKRGNTGGPVQRERKAPSGNINGAWKHDLHQDDGPVQPRIRDRPRARADNVQIHRRLTVEQVPVTVSKEDMIELIAAAGCKEHIENVTRQPCGNRLSKFVIDFMTEKAAYKVYAKYQDVALDDQPVKLTITGIGMPQTLRSGVKVSKTGQMGGHQQGSAARAQNVSGMRGAQQTSGVRGRGSQGSMRSDRVYMDDRMVE